MSYNFLLLIILIVIHWVFPRLGRSASILKNTGSQMLWTVPQPPSTPCQGDSSLATEPQLWKTGLQTRNQGPAAGQRVNPNSICAFSMQPPFPPAGSSAQLLPLRRVASCTGCCCTKSQDCRESTSGYLGVRFREHSPALSESQVFTSLMLSTFSVILRRCCSVGARTSLL